MDGRLSAAPLPGGLPAALSALDDRAAPDRSQFLVEVIRRFHDNPSATPADSRLAPLRSLLAHLEASSTSASAEAPAPETVPLPLSPATWIEVVFGGSATPDTLVSAILQSRNASLLYCALLSLDDATRAWLGTRRDLISDLASAHTAAFLVAAPGLRVRDGRMQLPGGEAAEPAWAALARTGANDPAAFIRNVVEQRRGRLAFFLGAMSRLSTAQVGYALKLDSADSEDRIAAARHLLAVFEHVAQYWDVDRLPFWRPALDPALLLAELRVDEHGRPVVPGMRRFWMEVFADPVSGDSRDADSKTGSAGPADFFWLCERVFAGLPVERERRYNIVLFASRNLESIGPDVQRDAVEAVRAAWSYPALTAALERAGLADVHAFAAAARRAAALGAIRDRTRANRALLQFQGTMALIARSAKRGGVPSRSLPTLVSSLSAVDVNREGDYEGRLVDWLSTHVMSPPDDVPEAHLVRMLAGTFTVEPEFVEWEGTRYRVDLTTAEATRLQRLLGDEPPPFISSARALAGLAKTIADASGNGDRLRAAGLELAAIAEAIGDHLQDSDASALRKAAASLQRAVRTADSRRAARLAPALRVIADGLLARGLLELAYAAALGQPGAAAISASEAASRHDFGLPRHARQAAWQLPEAGTWDHRGWHVRGSLLGLDVRLAQFSLVRISSRPPATRPSLNDIDRRVFMQAVNLVDPAALSEPRRRAVLGALQRGRARLASVQSPDDVLALADELRLSPVRRSLLEWAVAHEPERVAASFSLSEILWLGAEPSWPRGLFDPWGAPGEPRVGCLCLRLDRASWEPLAGRWNTGIFASRFPDLNLRLAELLAEMGMPAALLAPVLAAATVDFVENANTRDQGDRRGLLEFVRELRRERVEEYLALLTTDGPLVPVGAAASAVYARSLQ
ncbi:MAG TPA: hypothetical protein VK886_15650 [Vicinamibacterales bacterium]|nr:hypothetical protein [Vicinamibacterales bacterium]